MIIVILTEKYCIYNKYSNIASSDIIDANNEYVNVKKSKYTFTLV